MLPSRTILFICLAFFFVETQAAPMLGINDTGDDNLFDLADAMKDIPTKPPAVDPDLPDIDLDFEDKAPVNPKKPNSDSKDFDLDVAVDGEDIYTPTKKPSNKPHGGGSGGEFGDSDLINAAGDNYNPDQTNSKGRSAGGRSDDTNQGSDQGQGTGTIAGIISGVLLAVVGGASSYIAYQKKKLCFSLQGNSTEQSTKQDNVHGQREDPQSYSTLLQSQPVGSN
ncbi:CD99 molecule isoform X2 [Heptranchias perlo]|uniref:CD99 molecule isoform X2 n=1 Tax=Heptranchias perlo TaxID=212740 RepID=UPI00355A5432